MNELAYLVTGGNLYDDYFILGAFSTREKAEKYLKEAIKAKVCYVGDIEEWPIDKKEGLVARKCYMCTIDANTGNITDQQSYDVLAPPRLCVPKYAIQKDITSWKNQNRITAESYVSEEHAKKCAIKLRQRILKKG